MKDEAGALGSQGAEGGGWGGEGAYLGWGGEGAYLEHAQPYAHAYTEDDLRNMKPCSRCKAQRKGVAYCIRLGHMSSSTSESLHYSAVGGRCACIYIYIYIICAHIYIYIYIICEIYILYIYIIYIYIS